MREGIAEASMAGEQQRDPALDEIAQAYRAGDLVLFVGAGLSIAAGLPSPLGLVERAAAYAKQRGVEEEKLAEIAVLAGKKKLPDALWALRLALGSTEFGAFIERQLDDGVEGTLPPLALALGKLAPGLRGVLTTNLDLLVERAFGGAWPALARPTADVAQRRRFILKLHGTLADRSTWVLTREEHDQALHHDPRLHQALGALFNSCHLLFIGHDLDGEDFDELLARVSALAGPQPPRHFALVPSGALGNYQKQRLEEAGVRLVMYDEGAGEAGGPVALLETLAASLGPASREEGERRGRRGERAKASDGEKAGEERCPFPGLEVFDRDRAELFFGREAEVSEAVQELGDGARGHRRWLQIEGPSGAGKSSLARAGVVAAVEKGWVQGAPKQWRVAVLRPGVDPVLSLATGVRAALADRVAEARGLGAIVADFRAREGELAAFLREQVPAGEGFLLVVDQLEEAFSFARGEARATFDRLLAAALRDKGGPLYLVTTIRSDLVGRMSALPALEGLLNAEASRYLLKAMSGPGLRAAIVEPAKAVGLGWERGLSEALLEEASRAEGGLPLLAHVLQALWAKRKKGLLTHEAYGELGGLGGALSRSADAMVAGLGTEGEARARRLLLKLVKIGRGVEDARRTLRREEAMEAAGGGEEGERVLGRLSGARDLDKPEGAPAELRLLVVGEEGRVDLVHEALLRRWATLRGWIDEGRKALERRDDLEAAAQVWEAAGSPEEGLPSGAQLAYLRGAEAAGERERAFLEAAGKREQRRARRGRLIVAGLSAAVVAFGGLSWFAGVQRRKAEQRLDDAIAVADEVVFVVDRRLATVAGAAEARRELLDQTSRLQERLLAGAGDSKKARRSRMAAHNQRGDLARTHDDLGLARQEYEAGRVIAGELLALDPDSPSARDDLAVSHERLGVVAQAGGDLARARELFDENLALRKALAAGDPKNAAFQRDLSVAYNKRGEVAQAGGDLAQARAFFAEGLEQRKALVAADPGDAERRRDLSVSYERLGDVAVAGGDLAAARGFFDEALALRKALAAADPGNAARQRDLSVSEERRGDLAQAGGDLAAARGFFDEALALRKALAAADPKNAVAQRDLAVSAERRGDIAQASGDLAAARAFFGEGLAIFKALTAADPKNAELQRDLSISEVRLGDIAQASGELSVARALFDEGLALRKILAAADPQNAALQVELALCHVKAIDVALAMNDPAAARAHQVEATTLLDRLDRAGLGKGNAQLAKIRAYLATLPPP